MTDLIKKIQVQDVGMADMEPGLQIKLFGDDRIYQVILGHKSAISVRDELDNLDHDVRHNLSLSHNTSGTYLRCDTGCGYKLELTVPDTPYKGFDET